MLRSSNLSRTTERLVHDPTVTRRCAPHGHTQWSANREERKPMPCKHQHSASGVLGLMCEYKYVNSRVESRRRRYRASSKIAHEEQGIDKSRLCGEREGKRAGWEGWEILEMDDSSYSRCPAPAAPVRTVRRCAAHHDGWEQTVQLGAR